MDDSRKQLLKSLLDQSIPDVVIRDRSIEDNYGREMTHMEYRRLYQTNRYNPNVKQSRYDFRPYLKNESIKQKLFEIIRHELSQYLDKDRIVCATTYIVGGLATFCLKHILQDILKIAIIYNDSMEAVSHFEKWAREDQIDFQDMILLSGIRTNQEFEISDGIRLINLPPAEWELPDTLPLLIGDSGQEFLCGTIMVIDRYATPRFYTPGSKIRLQKRYKNTEFSDFDPEDFLRHLSLVSRGSIKSRMWWRYLNEKEPLNTNSGACTVYKIPDNDTAGPLLCEPDIIKAKNQYVKFDGLDENIKEKLIIAIDRWIKSKRENPVNRIIDLGIAFEAIYLGDGNEQLSFTFRLRGAWYLGNNPSERLELLKLFQAIYDCRSQAVHTGELSSEQKIKSSKEKIPTEKLLDEADGLCAKSIVKIINDGRFPNWDSLVLGDNATQNLPTNRP